MPDGRWRDNRYAPHLERVERGRGVGGKSIPAEIHPSDTDFGLDSGSLVEFVLKARIDLLAERTYDPERGWVILPAVSRMNRGDVAELVGWNDARLTTFLARAGDIADPRGRLRHATKGHRRKSWAGLLKSEPQNVKRTVAALDAQLQMFAMRSRGANPEVLHQHGTMTNFWQEMIGSGETAAPMNLAQGRWFHDLVEAGPQNAAEALMAGDALLALLAAANDLEDAATLVDTHREQVTRTVRGLLTVASRPPGRGSGPAVQTLALLGCLPIQWTPDSTLSVSDLVVEHAEQSPVGFLTMPVLTRMVVLSSGLEGAMPAWWSTDGHEERKAVWRAVRAIREFADRDPYPASCLFVETLRAMRMTDRGELGREALTLLDERARRTAGPVRERAYAAYCVSRAIDADHDAVQRLVEVLHQSGEEHAQSEEGLRYAARIINLLRRGRGSDATLEGLLLVPGDATEQGSPETNVRDELALDEAALAVDAYIFPERILDSRVQSLEFADAETNMAILDRLPDSIREAFVSLVRYSLLSIDGGERRRASRALREAGVAAEAACLVAQVLEDDRAPLWTREHAAAVLGHLTDPAALDVLVATALGGTLDSSALVRATALWSIGDIAHPNAQVLEALLVIIDRDQDEPLAVQRAATYALASIHPEPDGLREPVTDRLFKLAKHPNDVVSGFAKWGLLERGRAINRTTHRRQDELWGTSLDLRAVLDSVLGEKGKQ